MSRSGTSPRLIVQVSADGLRGLGESCMFCPPRRLSDLMPYRRIRLSRVAFPDDGDELILGVGTDVVTGEKLRMVIPPQEVLKVLVELHAERKPTLQVHTFDILDPWIWRSVV